MSLWDDAGRTTMEKGDVQVDSLPSEAQTTTQAHLEWFLGYTGLHPLSKPPIWAFRERARYLRVKQARESMLEHVRR